MERAWQPSRNACLTLKQLGLSAAQIQASVEAFRDDAAEQTDLAFMRFARDAAGNEAVAQRVANLLELPLHWQPPDNITCALLASGYQPDAIAHYRGLFVLMAREKGRALRDPGKAFFAFCCHRCTRLPAPLPSEWLPATITLQQLISEQGLSPSRIPEVIEHFTRTHQDKLSADWDNTFATWIAKGRAPGAQSC
ncbi:MAG: hypothetical protein ACK5HY_09220 [Parahaliea sp.]